MNLIGGIGKARRQLFEWFGGLALSAKAGIVTAFFVTMSAGVVIGAPYTPSSVPWLTPAVAGYETLQTPSALNPSMVVVAASSTASTGPTTTNRGTAKASVTSTSTAQQTAGAATTSAAASTSSRLATTMAPATTAAGQAKTTAKATTAQTSASVYYKNCAEASKSGAAPITSGQPGYRAGLDPNHNGVACE